MNKNILGYALVVSLLLVSQLGRARESLPPSAVAVETPATVGPSAPAPATPQTADNVAPSPSTSPVSQAPDEVIKKLSALIHGEKYTEAQQLISGLMIAYPDDARLIKAKGLLEKLLTTAKPGESSSANGQPTAPATQTQPAQGQFTGMDKLEYNSLIELGREAQQTTDLEQQKTSLKQFMSKSSAFLLKHPEQMLLWQIRAAAALSLDDADAGYEAGQKLLAAGAADSGDSNQMQILSKLNNKGWLDKEKLEYAKKYAWIVGTWRMSSSDYDTGQIQPSDEKEIFSKTDSGDIEGCYVSTRGYRVTNQKPDMRGRIVATGEIEWERYLFKFASKKDGKELDLYQPATYKILVDPVPGNELFPSGWHAPTSYSLSDDKKTMTMVFPRQTGLRKRKTLGSEHPVTMVFEKISDSEGKTMPPPKINADSDSQNNSARRAK